ncbi:MAG TPA: hypothetical protein VGZ02_16295 [Candidatus Baltobacteraceae bacterium]|jgi:hypothetical protein|nr:hypothetical protein [Candidatus Baltobacteraceae bacterium]
MQTITETMRLPSPAPRPQSLAFDGELLWMGSIDTCRIYAIDPVHWTVREEAAAPGKPWGMTAMGDELRVLCGEGDDDRRIIRRFIPGHGFKNEGAIACPGDTGSQLGYDGDRLYVSQWYNKKVLSLDAAGGVGSIIDAPHGIAGQVVFGGAFYLLSTDDEESDQYFVTRIDARNGKPRAEDLALVTFPGRALAYDGMRFWSNHRENNEIVAFTIE